MAISNKSCYFTNYLQNGWLVNWIKFEISIKCFKNINSKYKIKIYTLGLDRLLKLEQVNDFDSIKQILV